MKASILINNHNYGSFLGEAIESSVRQTYADTEVIVVDDGSTDDSLRVAGEYGSSVRLVTSDNRGQNSAVNLGVEAAHGEVLFFLDSDDFLHRDRVQRVMTRLADESLTRQRALVYNTIQRVGVRGHPIYTNWRERLVVLRRPLASFLKPTYLTRPEPTLLAYKESGREIEIANFPPSAMAMTRSLAEKVFPLPIGVTKAYSDIYLNRGAKLLGPCIKVPECLTYYRMHGSNFTASRPQYEVDGRKLKWPREVEEDIKAYLSRLAA